MKVNIYYGGRGLIDDPAIYVIDKMTEVLEEIRVSVTRYNLYEQKNGLSVLPNTLKEADGVIISDQFYERNSGVVGERWWQTPFRPSAHFKKPFFPVSKWWCGQG